MPAIQVARTDTFEQQRQKINQLGSTLFNITAGGSDLSTGNLKLGNGTRIAPSLAFISQESLGIYKSNVNTIGIVSSGKKIADYSETNILSYKNFTIQQNILNKAGLAILNYGQNYTAGIYQNIKLFGGTGDDASLDITVTEYAGIFNSLGKNYFKGNYSAIPLIGGSGTGSIASFTIEGINGNITNAGISYIPGNYNNIPLTGGSGTGAKANVSINGTTTLNGSISASGSSYTQGVYNFIEFLNTPTSTFVLTSIANPGTPPPNNVYQVDGVTQNSLTLIRGNTYRFNVSSSTLDTHPLIFRTTDNQLLSPIDYVVVSKGSMGTSGSFVDLIIKPSAPTGNIKYDCSNHPGMGGTITVVSGTSGQYGSGGISTVSVNASGQVSLFTILNAGSGYKQGDILQVYAGNVGGTGSGFTYTLSAPTYTGIINSITITDDGLNYLKNDVLSINNTSLGGQGSGFQYTITSDPGIVKNFTFVSKGSNYAVGNLLSLPANISGVQTTLKGQVFGLSTTLNTSSSIITVTSTDGIVSGMNVTVDPLGSTGALNPNTTVLSVNSLTQITISQNPSSNGAAVLNFSSPGNLATIQLLSVAGIVSGSFVSKTSGTGILAQNTTVQSINSVNNTITLSSIPTKAGAVTLEFIPPYGSGTENFEYEITSIGSIESFDVNEGGNGYSVGDVLTVNASDLVPPITYSVFNRSVQIITFVGSVPSTIFSVGDTIVKNASISSPSLIYQIKSSGGIIQSILVQSSGYANGDIITGVSVSTANYEINTASQTEYRYFIDTGSGLQVTPNLTLYKGSSYIFDLSDNSNSSHLFSLSKFRDGIWGPSLIENIQTTLSNTSTQITVTSTTGILPGMSVSVTNGVGSLSIGCIVSQVIGSNTVILSTAPTSSGIATLTFRGVEYTQSVTRTNNSLKIKVTENTPNLYYYCATNNSSHQNEGGADNEESLITINPNNPQIFGSNFSLSVSQLTTSDVIIANVNTGQVSATSFSGNQASFNSASISGSLTVPSITNNSIITSTISSQSSLGLSGTSVNITGNFNVGSTVQIIPGSGNITTSGVLQTNNSLNVNNILVITNNNISTVGTNNILLTPPSGRVAKIDSTTALVIPSGTTAQRPTTGIVSSGSIRFNTDTNQYEGYSGTTSSWSSLGGVRDLDGNTYITAEFTIGSNDNTLWFYNDSINTVKFTPEYQEFVSVKKVRSVNTSAPTYVDWAANTPVTVGQYLKYRNNIYEVVTAGTTGTSGNEPTSTTGTNFANGTATLKFFITAVAPLTFEEISEVRIAPNGGTSLSINNDLRFATNVISTDTNDLLLRPNSGKKVTVDAKTSLVLPVGTTNERGAPVRGSVRFNTTILQYEGYDGANWSSLGGVRDVDGNTYIIPELTPGGNQNILYFYNNGSNTLRVTENEIQLDTIDTIASPTSNALNLEASLVTFNNLAASIDTSSATRTFISTTKDNLDLGLSSGIVNDPLLRLSDTGDIFYNLGFGTGVFNGIKIFDKGLKELELADYKILTEDVTLTKNTVDTGSSIAYDPSIHRSAKVQIVAHNETTGDKEFVEYSVIDKGSDIFHTDFGNVKTGAELISSVFDFDANNRVRVTFTLDSAISAGNVVKVTVISNIIKR